MLKMPYGVNSIRKNQFSYVKTITVIIPGITKCIMMPSYDESLKPWVALNEDLESMDMD